MSGSFILNENRNVKRVSKLCLVKEAFVRDDPDWEAIT
jgi:hypothetical protein